VIIVAAAAVVVVLILFYKCRRANRFGSRGLNESLLDHEPMKAVSGDEDEL